MMRIVKNIEANEKRLKDDRKKIVYQRVISDYRKSDKESKTTYLVARSSSITYSETAFSDNRRIAPNTKSKIKSKYKSKMYNKLDRDVILDTRRNFHTMFIKNSHKCFTKEVIAAMYLGYLRDTRNYWIQDMGNSNYSINYYDPLVENFENFSDYIDDWKLLDCLT